MITTTQKIDFLASCFGEDYNLSRDSKNIAFVCPSCGDKKDASKKKFSICLETLMCHCWVCSLKGKTPYRIIKDHCHPKQGSRNNFYKRWILNSIRAKEATEEKKEKSEY